MLAKKHRLAMLAFGLMSAASAPALATTTFEMSFEDLVAAAGTVVVGEATASRVEQREGSVVTVTTFRVDTLVVGDAVATVDVASPGGIIKPGKFRIQETHAGAPVFPLGSEALLFLNYGPADAYAVVGFSQGAVTVVKTAAGKSVRLPGSRGLETVAAAAARIRKEKASPRRRN
jgi:malonyl CoA-acyl carrier protein transacylase